MRSTLYWLISTALAAICMNAAATPQTNLGIAAAGDTMRTVTQADPMRAVLLGIGVMAMAYTYRRVWANFRGSEKRR